MASARMCDLHFPSNSIVLQKLRVKQTIKLHLQDCTTLNIMLLTVMHLQLYNTGGQTVKIKLITQCKCPELPIGEGVKVFYL